jgi:guanine deaminase
MEGASVDDDMWLSHAVELATANVAGGGGPFGAVIVRGDELVATGQNQVTRELDPTAHAEVVAIRSACGVLGEFSLAGCTIYASCEPCPLCLAAALWARLDRIVYAADRDDAARVGFDDRWFHDLFGKPRSEWDMSIVANPLPGSTKPFDAWLAKSDRVRY